MHYLKLIRFYNLLIIAATMYAIRWLIIYPVVDSQGLSLELNEFLFFLLVFTMMCIAAAGYVINDYFDRKADYINNPDSVIVDKKIHRRFAIILHSVLNITGIITGTLISYLAGNLLYSLIFIAMTGILWFYSTTFKRMFLTGNIVVSLLTALTPVLVLLFEPALYNNQHMSLYAYKTFSPFNHIMYIILGFSYFAFIINMVREIIKDIEDIRGDTRMGCKTLPIVAGVYPSKIISLILISFTALSLMAGYFLYLSEIFNIGNNLFTLIYFIIIVLMLILAFVFIIRANKTKHYAGISSLLKIILFAGLLYSVLFSCVIF